MAANVSSIGPIMEAHREEADGKRSGLLTRDLLGEGALAVGSLTELDLELQVPNGWERRLDLKVFSNSQFSFRYDSHRIRTESLHRLDSDQPFRELHDLNLPPPSSSTSLPEDSFILDLKLAGRGIYGDYQSVCTLEKVKSALERAHRRQPEEETACASGSPSSVNRAVIAGEDSGGLESCGGMMAAACPSCLLYVLISRARPTCPRCDSHVPVPVLSKKRRFDLNSS